MAYARRPRTGPRRRVLGSSTHAQMRMMYSREKAATEIHSTLSKTTLYLTPRRSQLSPKLHARVAVARTGRTRTAQC